MDDKKYQLVHDCHHSLHETRQNIINSYKAFFCASATYYTMCELQSGDLHNESELAISLAELRRRGMIVFDKKQVGKLENDYVQSLKMLKQYVDKAVSLCDQISTISRTSISPVQESRPQSLEEALEAELSEEPT